MLFKDGFLKFQEHNLGYHFILKRQYKSITLTKGINYIYEKY